MADELCEKTMQLKTETESDSEESVDSDDFVNLSTTDLVPDEIKELVDEAEERETELEQTSFEVLDFVKRNVETIQNNCHSCRMSQPKCKSHVIPKLFTARNFFEGYENKCVANYWLHIIEQHRIKFGWSDKLTLEVARANLVNEAIIWEECNASDAKSWKNWKRKFRLEYVYVERPTPSSIDAFYHFLGYRQALPVEMHTRRITVPMNLKKARPVMQVSENPFDEFINRAKDRAVIWKQFDIDTCYPTSKDDLDLYIVVKTPIHRLRKTSAKVNGSVVNSFSILKLKTDESNECKMKGSLKPFSNLKEETVEDLEDIISKGCYYSWYEQWIHLHLSDKITTLPGNTKTIRVNYMTYRGYVDMSAEHCTITESQAKKNNFSIIEDKKAIKNYNGEECKSIGHFSGPVFIVSHRLRGRATWFVVPDDSQPVSVIVGRSITRFPLVYHAKCGGLEREEFNQLLKERPEIQYPILENLKEFPKSDF